jgi:hypothetical protein
LVKKVIDTGGHTKSWKNLMTAYDLLNCVSMENIDHENMLEKVSKKVGALL